MTAKSEPSLPYLSRRGVLVASTCSIPVAFVGLPFGIAPWAVRGAIGSSGQSTTEDFVPVTDFGPIGRDDNVLLRRAFAAAPRILIPSDTTLTITADVVIPAGCKLVGAGATSRVRLISNGAADNIKIRLSSDTTLSNLTITEIGARGRSGVYGTIFAERSSRCRIERVDVSGSSSTGMLFIASSDLEIDRCSVHDTWADGIHSQRGCTRVTITNCNFTRTGDDGIAFVSHGYDQYGQVSDCTVRSCTVTDVMRTGSGIAIVGAAGISVADCRIDGTPLSGIRIASASFNGEGSTIGRTIRIIGNVITNTGHGIDRGNNGGIFIEGNRDIVIQDNRISRPATWGIATSNAVDAIRIVNNEITDSGDVGMFISAASRQGHYLALHNGLRSTGPARGRDILIDGNTIRNPLASGIHVSGAPNAPINALVLRNNRVQGVKRRSGTSIAYGIFLDYADDVVLLDNQVEGRENIRDLFVGSAVRRKR